MSGLGMLRESDGERDETPTAGIRVLQGREKNQVSKISGRRDDSRDQKSMLSGRTEPSGSSRGSADASGAEKALADQALMRYLQEAEKRLEEQLRKLDASIEGVRPTYLAPMDTNRWEGMTLMTHRPKRRAGLSQATSPSPLARFRPRYANT